MRRIDTGQFQHLVLERDGPGTHLRIYVEGDGTPWVSKQRVSVDPTPTNPVLLELMKDSPGAAVYLGRPCYFGLSTSTGCEPRLWTSDRYGQEVVQSMCSAANAIARHYQATSVQLIGYSGGGAVVVGMRTCTLRLTGITTIAANLDPQAWTEYHGYAPLADLSPLRPETRQPEQASETHWQCKRDENIPPAITDSYFVVQQEAARRIVESCTHASGWDHYWPQIISGPPES